MSRTTSTSRHSPSLSARGSPHRTPTACAGSTPRSPRQKPRPAAAISLAVQPATTWDQKRFPPSPTLIVLETTTVPAPGTWLRLTLDARMPSAEGPALPPEPQSSVAELPPMFFITGPNCRMSCDPSNYNPINFTEQVDAARFAAAMTARDITDPAREQVIRPAAPKPASGPDTWFSHGIEDAGFDRQPPARTWLLGLAASLQSYDGQTLGYPWIGIVENWHERAFTNFGDGHGVWEPAGGTQSALLRAEPADGHAARHRAAAGQPHAPHSRPREKRLS